MKVYGRFEIAKQFSWPKDAPTLTTKNNFYRNNFPRNFARNHKNAFRIFVGAFTLPVVL